MNEYMEYLAKIIPEKDSLKLVKNEAEKENKKININMCDTLEQTIEIAKKSAKKGDIVLFSPASASFDMFKNFADRGNQFKDLVNKI